MRKSMHVMALASMFCASALKTIYAGYQIAPMITILEPSAGKVNAIIEAKFVGEVKVPVALELKVKRREIDINGKVLYKEDKSTGDLVVYPTQIILMPDDLQRVQIQWAGTAEPNKEIAYGLIAEEAPVRLDKEKKYDKAVGMVSILTRYEAIVVIRPKDVRPNILVESAEMKKDSTGTPKLVFTLFNSGTGLQELAGMRLMISPLNKNGQVIPGKNVEYQPPLNRDQVKHSIFAGYRRMFDLPWPTAVPVGPVRVAVDFIKK